MERVQFQQEQMLPELKDLVEKGLFTQKEVKAIIRKRTTFEIALVRRIAKKGDFLRYAAYEMQLEALRKKRLERLKLPKAPPSVSDYALVRRQFQIFERALKKFKSDVGLWIQYIQTAKREGARALVGRITARALQLHPNTSPLYILAASHELDHLSPAAARTLLQRGLRLNADSVELWREYVKMELGFVESIRRRWEVLGISIDASAKGKGKQMEDVMEVDSAENGDTERPTVDTDKDAQAEADMARREILEGAIVKSVIVNAVKALPRVDLFRALQELLSSYPSPPSLKHALLEYLHSLLRQTLPLDPQAVKLLAARFLTSDLDAEGLVDALEKSNEELFHAALHADSRSRHDIEGAFAEFTLEWCGKDIDDNLKQYLITSLQRLIRRSTPPTPILLAAHVRVCLANMPGEPSETLRIARKYTVKAPQSPAVWLARLEVERAYGGEAGADKAWAEARGSSAGSPDELEAVWTWGLDGPTGAVVRSDAVLTLERLLRESMRDAALRAVHDALLVRRVRALYGDHRAEAAPADGDAEHARVDHENDPELTQTRGHHSAEGGEAGPVMTTASRLADVRRIAREWLPSGRVWEEVFAREEERGVLEAAYELWRKTEGVEACIAWAGWLMAHNEGARAMEAVMGARSWLGADDREELARRWGDMLRNVDDRGEARAE